MNWHRFGNEEAIFARCSVDMQLLSIACRTDREKEVFAAYKTNHDLAHFARFSG